MVDQTTPAGVFGGGASSNGIAPAGLRPEGRGGGFFRPASNRSEHNGPLPLPTPPPVGPRPMAERRWLARRARQRLVTQAAHFKGGFVTTSTGMACAGRPPDDLGAQRDSSELVATKDFYSEMPRNLADYDLAKLRVCKAMCVLKMLCVFFLTPRTASATPPTLSSGRMPRSTLS